MFVRFFYCKNTNNLLNFSIQPPRSAKNNCQTNSAQQDIAGGVHHIPWVTLRSPTAKPRRLTPPRSRPVLAYSISARDYTPIAYCHTPLQLGFALHSTVIGITLAEGANMRR